MISNARDRRSRTFIKFELLVEPDQNFEVSFKTNATEGRTFKLCMKVVLLLLLGEILYLVIIKNLINKV